VQRFAGVIFLGVQRRLGAVPLPGDILVMKLESIVGDMASLAVKWRKPSVFLPRRRTA
jgi:hypothetical protein